MRSLTSAKWRALAILGVVVAGCSEGGTQAGPTAAASSVAAPSTQQAANTKAPTIVLTMEKHSAPPVVGQWIMPSAWALTVDVRGSDFPVGATFKAEEFQVRDGVPRYIGGEEGIFPPDGSLHMTSDGYCLPTPPTDLYVVVTYNGMTTTSKHVAPLC